MRRFWEYFRETDLRQATVNDIGGTGILGPYTTTSFSPSEKSLKSLNIIEIRYEKNTQKNFPFQKFDLKLDLGSNCICSSSDVYNHSRIRHYSKRTKIYENLSRTLCVCDSSRKLESQTTDGTYLL